MIFKMFCKHDWKALVSIITPKAEVINACKMSESLFEKLYYGSAKVVFSCRKCGKLIEKEYVGEVNA